MSRPSPHRFDDLPPIDPALLQRRRERVFLVLAGFFLGTLTLLNVLGISRFIVLASFTPLPDAVDPSAAGWAFGQWGSVSFAVAVGVLPYPLTFLCTDLISEFYGRKRANFLVWVGLMLNLWVLGIMWLGGAMPESVDLISYGTKPDGREVFAPPLPTAEYDADGNFLNFNEDWTFYRIQMLTLGAVVASMVAYLVAQFVDVQLFHFWKWLTDGRHLWIRNNGSTVISQFVDTFAVITITHFYAHALPVDETEAIWPQLWLFIGTAYAFKLASALLDTPVIYGIVYFLSPYLRIDPTRNHDGGEHPLPMFIERENGE